MSKEIIWNDLQNLNMFENPVGNTGRPKTWKSRLINLVFLNWSKRQYWKSPISPSWGCSSICSPLGKSMENNPTRQLSTKHPEHTTTLSKPELISNCRTVTARVGRTPGYDGSIFQNRSKRVTCGLNLLHTFELISHCRTVTSMVCMTPGNRMAANA